MKTKLVFGFGSLINKSSLLLTAPSASDSRKAYVKGYKRDFSVWAKKGSVNLTPANVPFCALDIQASKDTEARVNGICFTVNEDDFNQLVERECEYKTSEAPVYDFETDEKIGTCVIFSSCKNSGKYDTGSAAQLNYLRVCNDGARECGDKFYKEFLETTFIGDKPLSEMPELVN